jgi:ribulose kinase
LPTSTVTFLTPARSRFSAGESGQFRARFDGDHMLGAGGQQGGHVAAAGADFEHLVGILDAQFLQQAGFDTRCQHDLAAADRDFHVGECQIAVGGGTKSSRLTTKSRSRTC